MLFVASIFDGDTLIFINAMLSAVSALSMYAVHLNNRQSAGLGYWAFSNACFAIGFSVLLFLPFWRSIPIVDTLGANLVIDLGAITAYVAVLQFLGRPRWQLWLIIPCVGLMIAEAALFALHGVNMREMVILGVTARGIVTFGAGWMLLRHAEACLRPASTFSALFHFLWVAMLAVRAIWWIFGNYGDVGRDPTTPAALIARILLTFAVTPSYLWMSTRRLDHELIRQAHEDALTGVANRRAVWEQAPRRLAESVRNGTPLCLLMIDVDHFKSVNDRFGHSTGDQVLVGVASALSSQLRQNDLVGRIGGEEFMVLLSNISLDDAGDLAERLRLAVEKSEFPLPGGEVLHCTVSIGMSQVDHGDRDWDTLVQDADSALYCAKRLGRNRIELAPPRSALVSA